MGKIEDRIAELGLELPAAFAPPAGASFSFELVRLSGELAYVSGHGPVDGTEVLVAGKVGGGVSVEEAKEAGRQSRSAIGASELPFDMAVEVEAIVEVSG